MSSNITLINKLNPTRFDQNDKLKIKIDELCAKSFKNLNSTSEKELIKYLVDNIKLSIDYEVKDTKKNDPTDLEIFYKKYLSQLNDLINMKKKTLNSPSEHTSYNPLDILKQIQESIQKTIKDIDLKKRIMESFNAIKDTIISFYETIKNETINIFNGTTFSKIFHAGCELFLGPSESTKETSARIDSLIKDVEELGKTIASSKFFLHTIIEKVKEQGKLKIVNKLNNNPNHPEYQSSFPDLQVMNPKKENTWYPFIDENFDTEEKKGTFKVNQKFKDRMNRSIEKSHYNYFTNNDIWTVSNTSNSSSKNIFSTISNFQKLYENLRFSKELNKDFMTDFNSSLFVIDGNVVFSTNKQEMMDKFKKFVPNIMDQKLISAYAHPKVLGQSYFQLISEHPELNQYQIVKSRNFYKITHIDNNQIKLVATNLSDLRSTDENIVRPYHSFGVRTSIILSDKDLPIIKYSNFVH